MNRSENGLNTLSVIIPVNLSRGLSNNLIEWISQELPVSFEIIIVLDTNDQEFFNTTSQFIQGLSTSNLNFIQSRLASPGLTRNLGLEIAKGDWVTFWDDDDLPNLSEVFRLVEQASLLSLDFAVGNFEIRSVNDPNMVRTVPTTSNWQKDIAYFPGLWRFIFKSSTLTDIKFGNRHLGEDQDFLLDYNWMRKKGKRFEVQTYSYFQGNSNQITAQPPNLIALHNLAFSTFIRIFNRDYDPVVVSIFFWRQYLTLFKNSIKQGNLSWVFPPKFRLRFCMTTRIPSIVNGLLEMLYRKLLDYRSRFP